MIKGTRLQHLLYNVCWVLEHLGYSNRATRFFTPIRERIHSKILENLKNTQPNGWMKRVESRTGLTEEEFKNEYLYRTKPVVLKAFANDWPAVGKWTPEYFKEKYPDYKFETYSHHANRGGTSKSYTLASFVDSLYQGGKDYFRFGALIHDRPELKKDIPLVKLKGFKRWIDFWTASVLFLGPGNSNTFFHMAFINNFFVQIYGHKRWYIFSPDQSALFLPPVDRAPFFRSSMKYDELEKIKPFLPHMKGYVVDLEPGDVLFVPPFHWHFVENETISIGASCRIWSAPSALKSSLLCSFFTLFASSPNALSGLLGAMTIANGANFFLKSGNKYGFKSNELAVKAENIH